MVAADLLQQFFTKIMKGGWLVETRHRALRKFQEAVRNVHLAERVRKRQHQIAGFKPDALLVAGFAGDHAERQSSNSSPNGES
jgi:hypothetical protein